MINKYPTFALLYSMCHILFLFVCLFVFVRQPYVFFFIDVVSTCNAFALGPSSITIFHHLAWMYRMCFAKYHLLFATATNSMMSTDHYKHRQTASQLARVKFFAHSMLSYFWNHCCLIVQMASRNIIICNENTFKNIVYQNAVIFRRP